MWPLVGRSEELDAAQRALTEPGAGVVIDGDPGVGKTRLADEVLTAATAGATVVRMVATRAAATIPFGAAAPLLGDAGSAPGPRSTDTSLALQRRIAELAAEGALVIGVDDAHLLDEATATLLHQVVSARQARLVITVRTGESVDGVVRSLWDDPSWTRIELAALSREDVAALVPRALGGQVESTTVDRLWDTTQGNALFLRELCRDALDAGTLARQHGVWVWNAEPFTGPRLHDLVAARLGQLSPEEHVLAGLLALGEPLPVDLVAERTRPGLVDELAERGLVTVELVDDRRLARLAHPLYAESVRAGLGPLETTDLYASLAEGLAKEVDDLDVDDRLRLAIWAVSSNVDVEASLLASAACDALRREDAGLAERLARAALGLPHGAGIRHDPPPPPVELDPTGFAARLVLGEALGELGRPDEAEAVLRPLAALATDDRERARVALARLAAIKLMPERLGDARRIAVTAGIREPAQRNTVLAGLAGILSHAGALEEGGTLALGLLGADDEVVRLHALAPASTWLVHIGRADEALRAASELFEVATAHDADVPRGRGWTVSAGATALLATGRACEVEAVLSGTMKDPQRRHGHARGTLALLNGRTALLRGRPASARTALREAVLALERFDPSGRRGWALALLAEAEALLGDGDAARATLDESSPRSRSGRYERDVQRASLWVTAAQGDVTGAIRQAIEQADDARSARHTGFELMFLEVAVRLGGMSVADRLASIAARVDGPLAATLGQFAPALTTSDGRRLDAVADHFAGLGLGLHAAEAASLAARAHRRGGAAAAARAATEKARYFHGRCEGARTPALADGAPPGDLTRREREVALLAARGLSSRDIAVRFDVSVRTVDNQLGRVYHKLGISGRNELPSVLSALTPPSS